MSKLIRHVLCLSLLTAVSPPGVPSHAYTEPNRFEAYADHYRGFERLSETYRTLQEQGQALRQDHREALASITESDRQLHQLVRKSIFAQMTGAQIMMEGMATENDIQEMDTSLDQLQIDFNQPVMANRNIRDAEVFQRALRRWNGQSEIRIQGNAQKQGLLEQLAELRIQLDLIAHELKVLDVASNAVANRRMNQVRDLIRLTDEAMQWNRKRLDLFQDYWKWSDVEGTRCAAELRSALRVLRTSESHNVGAKFAQAITLMRLGEYTTSLAHLSELAKYPWMQHLVLAVRGELHFRMDQPQQAKQDLRHALELGSQDPRCRMHVALALQVGGMPEKAENQWRLIMRNEAFKSEALRNLAVIEASTDQSNQRQQQNALENAQLASQLGGREHWFSEYVLAYVQALLGKKSDALESIQRAEANALGDNQRLSLDLRLDIEQDHAIQWNFKR